MENYINIKNGLLHIGDPGLDFTDTLTIKVKPGKYKCEILYDKDLVSEIKITHESSEPVKNTSLINTGTIVVENCLCGFSGFPKLLFTNSEWKDFVSAHSEDDVIADDHMFFVPVFNNYYNVHNRLNLNNEIVEVSIRFIDNDIYDNSDEDEYCFEEDE